MGVKLILVAQDKIIFLDLPFLNLVIKQGLVIKEGLLPHILLLKTLNKKCATTPTLHSHQPKSHPQFSHH